MNGDDYKNSDMFLSRWHYKIHENYYGILGYLWDIT